jgi:hypothetical protein
MFGLSEFGSIGLSDDQDFAGILLRTRRNVTLKMFGLSELELIGLSDSQDFAGILLRTERFLH